jgi:hypothetical protein
MSSLVYACVLAGVATFSDRPCVERPPGPSEQNAIAFANLRETPPRLGVDRGGPPGSWPATPGSTVYLYRHKHGRRGR